MSTICTTVKEGNRVILLYPDDKFPSKVQSRKDIHGNVFYEEVDTYLNERGDTVIVTRQLG